MFVYRGFAFFFFALFDQGIDDKCLVAQVNLGLDQLISPFAFERMEDVGFDWHPPDRHLIHDRKVEVAVDG